MLDKLIQLVKPEFRISLIIISATMGAFFVTIIVVLKMILRSGKNLKTKIFSLSEDERRRGDGIDTFRFLYHVEKIERIRIQIENIKSIEMYKKQLNTQLRAFTQIKAAILDFFDEDLTNFLKESEEIILSEVARSNAFAEYKILINDITEENIHNIYQQDFFREDLCRMSDLQHENFKHQQSLYYRTKSMEEFKSRYNENLYIVPFKYHLVNGIKKGDEAIKEIVEKTQDEMRKNSVSAFERIQLLEEEIIKLKKFGSVVKKIVDK